MDLTGFETHLFLAATCEKLKRCIRSGSLGWSQQQMALSYLSIQA